MAAIRRVTLYKHGVGYFQLHERVQGDAEVRLEFKLDEMNDVLKSLMVHDEGGKVLSVSYDAHKPVSQLLQEIALEVPRTGGGSALYAKLQGAEVLVRTEGREVRGSIVGLEQRSMRWGGQMVSTQCLSLWSGTAVQHVNLADVEAVELCDPDLQTDLTYCLGVMFKTNKREAKQLTVFTQGEGERDLHLGYLVEAPTWKSSYRMTLSTDKDAGPFWEGWALVDNPRDEDWDNVELTLVSGMPVSFRQDLYSPRYISRTEVRTEREATVQPVVVSRAVVDPFAAPPDPFGAPSGDPFGASSGPFAAPSSDPFAAAASRDPFGASPDPFAAPSADPFSAPRPAASPPAAAARQQAAQVVAESSGERFFFRLQHPVTVKRSQSALVPLMGQQAEGGKVVLYNAATRASHPFAAVDLTNNTGMTLEGGPLVVVEDDAYAGEALLDTMRPGERRFVPFAVDLATSVAREVKQSDGPIQSVRAVGGQLWFHYTQSETTRYAFSNADGCDKTLWIEHPLAAHWTLQEPSVEQERTDTHYRFKTLLPAEGKLLFEVLLTKANSTIESLVNAPLARLKKWQTLDWYPEAALPNLSELIEAREQLLEAQAELRNVDARYTDTSREVERISSLLQKLGSSPEEDKLRGSYVVAMEAAEAGRTQAAGEQALLRSRCADLTMRSEALSNALDFDVRVKN